MSWLRANQYNFILLIVSIIFSISISEIYLRFTYKNNYLDTINSRKAGTNYYRLLNDKEVFYDITDLYDTDQTLIRFGVRNYNIKSTKNDKRDIDSFIFLGGSTTEARYVHEGYRFPDLVSNHSMNYGVSGNNMLDSYLNLKYILSQRDNGNVVQKVFILHGVNDLALLTRGSDPYLINDLKKLIRYREGRKTYKRIIFDMLKRSYVIAFIKFAYDTYVTPIRENIAITLKNGREENLSKPALSNGEYDEWLRGDMLNIFLKNREETIKKIVDLCKEKDIQLYFITQPHSYVDEYVPYKYDLREYYMINNKITSSDKSAGLMAMINSHTRKIANKFHINLIDGEGCFGESHDVSSFFYDSLHYTKDGSQHLADCILKYLRSEG